TDWNSIRLITIVLFISRIQYTVHFGSMKQMVEDIDPMMKEDSAFYGYITSLNNLGVAISGPVFGLLANKYGFRNPTLLAYCIAFCCNFGVIFLFNITSNGRYFALVIRFFAGISAGGSSILNTYWASVCASQDARTGSTYTEAAMTLGMVFGPLIQMLCIQIPNDIIIFHFLYINKYTVPAMIAIV
ncbi:hypothetical protein PMAYCL1PPCAC_31440, partial [Pristionchus mayeri]